MLPFLSVPRQKEPGGLGVIASQRSYVMTEKGSFCKSYQPIIPAASSARAGSHLHFIFKLANMTIY
jgi:hypothetical protein